MILISILGLTILSLILFSNPIWWNLSDVLVQYVSKNHVWQTDPVSVVIPNSIASAVAKKGRKKNSSYSPIKRNTFCSLSHQKAAFFNKIAARKRSGSRTFKGSFYFKAKVWFD